MARKKDRLRGDSGPLGDKEHDRLLLIRDVAFLAGLNLLFGNLEIIADGKVESVQLPIGAYGDSHIHLGVAPKSETQHQKTREA